MSQEIETTFADKESDIKSLNTFDEMSKFLDPKREPIVSVLLNIYRDGPVEQFEAMYSSDWYLVKQGYIKQIATIQDLLNRENECPLKPKDKDDRSVNSDTSGAEA